MTEPAPPAPPPAPPSPTPPARPAWTRALPPLLAAALVGGLGWALLRPAGNAGVGGGGPLVGAAAPGFKLTGLDGQPVALSDYRGRPVVLNFWASWCGPCREEAPLFARLAAQPGAPAVVGILFNETKPQQARDFARQYGLNYPHLEDPGVATALAYQVIGIPRTVFIDAQGVVRHVDQGGLNTARLNAGLSRIGAPGL